MPTPTEAVNKDGGGAVLRKEVRQAQAAPTGTDKPFAILRYAKLRSERSITGSAQHMRRSHPTPNADPARTPGNKILIGTEDPAADLLQLLPKEGERDMSGKLKRRSNSVLAVEVLITTSPEWWPTATPEQKAAWVDQSRAWLELEWGAENVAHLEIHYDEKTPHLTGLIAPLDELGHLNARAWIGGRASKRDPGSSLLSGHQTRYAAAVEPLGLRRGIMGSTARHQDIQAHYKALARAQEARAPQVDTPPLFGREGWAQDTNKTLRQKTFVLAHAAAELPVERQRRLAAERTAELANQRAEDAKAARRAMADEMRALPLPDVLAKLGLEEDHAKEPDLWKAGEKGARSHRIAVKGGKWFDHVADKGGGGAIDLVKHVMELRDFNEALSWLAANFGREAAAADYTANAKATAERVIDRAAEKRPPFTPPQPDPAAWPEVRRRLIESRALPAELVDAMHEAGDVYAITRPGKGRTPIHNACFIQRDMSGQATGAELKGTVPNREGSHWSGVAPGTRKGLGCFRVGVEVAQAALVAVVESAIDALSLAVRMQERAVKRFAILSTAGDGSVPQAMLDAIRPEALRFLSQDANPAGDKQAERMTAEREGEAWKRARPPAPFEDWNAELVAKTRARSDDQAGHVTPPTPSDPSASDPSPTL